MPLTTADTIIRVSPDSNVKKVAGAIMYCVTESDTKEAVVHAIGAGAVNQAAKSVAVARGMAAVRGRDLWTRIGFETMLMDNGEKEVSVMAFNVLYK